MKSKFGIISILSIVLVSIYGYVANIVKLFGMSFADPVTVELVLRVVGVFLAPIGVIMGFL